MRIVLQLEANKTVSQDVFCRKYHQALDGRIYEFLSKSSSLQGLHDKKDFKGFCFSPIYPVLDKEIKEKNQYFITISSAVSKIIEALFFSFKIGDLINLGEGSFTLLNVEIKQFQLKKGSNIETNSIINITEHKEGKIIALTYDKNKEMFINNLKKSLIKKYNFFTKKDVSLDFELFKDVEITSLRRGTYAIPLFFEEKKFNVIGSKLSFKLKDVSPEQLAIFQVCFDAGFGERNSYGMGMMVRR